jgi:multidrug resistance protein MdtO
MAFSPARLAGTLRFSLTTALATLLLLILQPPLYSIAPSLFMLFLISHDTPFNCFKDLAVCLSFAAIGTATALCLVVTTGNDPMARVLGLAVCTFLATFFFRASTVPIAALSFGCLTFMVISLWEIQIPAEQVLHLSLWPMGTLSTVAGCAIAVDYLLNCSDPAPILQREMKVRFEALEQLFLLCAAKVDVNRLQDHSAKVRRYATTGHGRMQVLLEQITKREVYGDLVIENLSKVILMLTRLLDLGAAFALHNGLERHEPARLERIGRALTCAREGQLKQIKTILGDSPTCITGELDRFEQTLHDMGEIVEPNSTQQAQVSHDGRSIKVFRSWLAPDAFTNPTYLVYGFKLSLCATICYVIYNGLKWPGISTAYFTVLFTGLTTTGATNRKLLFRIIGSTIGGLILGIGCMVFVFPNIESVTSFILVIAAVSFIGAWVAGSPYYGYIGLQIVFSFNLIAFEGFSAATQMTPARDRLLGIFLGLIVMFLIFHQIRPERTVDTMRLALARLLRNEAELVHLMGAEPANVVPSVNVIRLRTQLERLVATIHSFSEVVKYEFEPDRTGDMTISREILSAVVTSANLLFSIQTWPDASDAQSEGVQETRSTIETGLCDLARFLEQVRSSAEGPQQHAEQFQERFTITEPKSIGKAIDSYRELQMLCEGIAPQERAG